MNFCELDAFKPGQSGWLSPHAKQAVANCGGAGASGTVCVKFVDAEHVQEVAVTANAGSTERREAEFALSQMDSALRHVRGLAKEQQCELADAMCAIYC